MTERSRKQLLVLGVLAALFVAVILVSRGEAPAGGGAAPSNRQGTRAGAAPQTPPAVVDVRLESLEAEAQGPSEPERNLFAFKPKAPPPQPPAPPPPPRPVDVAPPVPQGPPPPPPIPLKFIGVLEIPSQGAKVAVLSDGRGGTFHAKEGEVVLGQYKLLKIGAESAEMSYVDGRGRQTLRLSGQ